MTAFLSNNGWHFSPKLCRYAVSLMTYKENGKDVKMEFTPKEKVEELLTKHGIKLEKKIDYDFVYLYHMFCSDLKKVPLDEKMKLLISKAVFEDDDAADGFIMRRWYATMIGNGEPVYWSEFLDD